MSYRARDQIWLVGDSITEFSFSENGIAARFADTYARSFDVVNRGFSGYNARWTLIALRQLLAPPAQQQQDAPRIRLFTLWLGANDCVAPGSVQHVPLADFRTDMAALVALMRERSPGTSVVLITPGPVQVERWNVGREARNRSNAQVEQYVQAVKELGEAEHVPVVDAYEALWAAAGSRDEAALERFYTDGLHFAAPGYEVVWKELMRIIKSDFPELDPAKVKKDFPLWSDVDHTNPEPSLQRGEY